MAISPPAQATQEAHSSTAAAGTVQHISDSKSKKQESVLSATPMAARNQTNRRKAERIRRRRRGHQEARGIAAHPGSGRDVPQVHQRHHPPLLTSGQKIHLFVGGTGRSVQLGGDRDTGRNQPGLQLLSRHGQGAAGYAKLTEAAFADSTSSQSLLTSPTQCRSRRSTLFQVGKRNDQVPDRILARTGIVGHKDSGGRTGKFLETSWEQSPRVDHRTVPSFERSRFRFDYEPRRDCSYTVALAGIISEFTGYRPRCLPQESRQPPAEALRPLTSKSISSVHDS